jgi:hypothetical protein
VLPYISIIKKAWKKEHIQMLQMNAKFTDKNRPASRRESRAAAPKEIEAINGRAYGETRGHMGEEKARSGAKHRCGP